ncbi:hypothetical protein MTR67_044080 [Solanum verrucosum]|uniref:RING-type domain-containing protein n=1 Tax=Solanum verrucosum TaxID=315347 RepID=A0AAF0UQ72_SOLVR|nr:hypothetical protein MTR67_044080 [Solanum verrucosum]
MYKRDDVHYDYDPIWGTDIIEVTCDNDIKKEKKSKVSKLLGKNINLSKEKHFDREDLARNNCGHIYHIDCPKEWNKMQNTCPICKRKVVVICYFTLRICAFLCKFTTTSKLISSPVT